MHLRGWFWLVVGLCLAAGPDLVAAEPLELKLLTFNLRTSTGNDGPDDWLHRRAEVAAVLRGMANDFLGMQEAQPEQVAYLREQLPEYRCLARSRRADPTVDEAVPLWYRQERWQLDAEEQGTFWLSDTPEEPGSTTWGNELPRIVTWGRLVEKSSGRGVYVFNTHLDHRSEPARAQSAVLLAQRIAARRHAEPVVVMGDFNAKESDPALQYLTGKTGESPLALLDTFRARYPDVKEAIGTFHKFTGTRSQNKIDYILALGPVEVVATEILHTTMANGRYLSDHFPVSAQLRFAIPGAP